MGRIETAELERYIAILDGTDIAAKLSFLSTVRQVHADIAADEALPDALRQKSARVVANLDAYLANLRAPTDRNTRDGWTLGQLDHERPPWWERHGLAESRFSVVAVRMHAGGQWWRKSLVTSPWYWPCKQLFRILTTPMVGVFVAGLFGLPRESWATTYAVEISSVTRSSDAS